MRSKSFQAELSQLFLSLLKTQGSGKISAKISLSIRLRPQAATRNSFRCQHIVPYLSQKYPSHKLKVPLPARRVSHKRDPMQDRNVRSSRRAPATSKCSRYVTFFRVNCHHGLVPATHKKKEKKMRPRRHRPPPCNGNTIANTFYRGSPMIARSLAMHNRSCRLKTTHVVDESYCNVSHTPHTPKTKT